LQFHRAIATASIASQRVSVQTAPREFMVNVDSVEADWDEEAQRVNVRVEIGVHSNGPVSRLPKFDIGSRFWHRCEWEGIPPLQLREVSQPITVIRVYDETGNVIETHEHAGEFKEW
jgi:hypothetical protein